MRHCHMRRTVGTGRARGVGHVQISRGDEGDTSQVPRELPGAEIGRSRDFANCRSQNVGRLQKHEGSPPAVQVVQNGRVGDRSRSTDWLSVPR